MNKIKKLSSAMNWKVWLGLLISAVFLYLAVREVDITQTWSVILSADIFLVFLAVLTIFFQYIIRAWHWYILLEPIKKTSFSNRLLSTIIGYAGICILPARLGEIIRANYLGQTEDISRSSVFGTIVIERIFDGFSMMLVLLIGFVGTKFPEEFLHISGKLRFTGFLFFIAFILVIIFIVGFKYKTEFFLNLLEKILFFLPNHLRMILIDIVRNLGLGLVPVKGFKEWSQVIFYTLLLYLQHFPANPQQLDLQP